MGAPNLILVAVILAAITAIYGAGRWDGSAASTARHQQVQTKHNEKVRKSDVQRDNEKPRSSGRDKLLEWLRQYGSE